jgi:DNA polymerase-4
VPTVLHIDIDAFFAAVEVALTPSLQGKPVIVGGGPNERGVVSTASYEARRYGVHSGMALRTAARRCPHAVFLRGRRREYGRVSRRFFESLKRFSPTVEAVSIDEAYIDLGGMEYLHPSVYRLAAHVKEGVERDIGLRVSAGLAFSKLGAKMATEAAKPGGICVIEDEETFISNLAVEKIPGIGPHTAVVLSGLGIGTVAEMRQAQPSAWKSLVAPHIYSSSRIPSSRRERAKSVSRETTFAEDISDQDLIASHLSYLTDRLTLHLVDHKLYAGRIEVKVKFSDFSAHTRGAVLTVHTQAYTDIWRPASSLLGDLMRRKPLALRLVGIKAQDLVVNRDLLPFVSVKGERFSSGVGEVRRRFGFSSLFTGREMLLEDLYPVEKDGFVLRTSSLTK